ncbi:hypothetical protein pb186bvf_006567 [Paramecium bursaria]
MLRVLIFKEKHSQFQYLIPMNSIPQYFKQLDAFGIPIQLKYKNETKYQTPVGGLFSLLIYGTSLAYAIMVFLKVNHKLKQSNKIILLQMMGFSNQEYFNQSEGAIDPFSQKSNIILPLLIKLNNTQYEEPIPIFSQSSSSYYGSQQTRQILKLPKLQLSHLSREDLKHVTPEIQYFLILTRCQSSLLKGAGQTCASEDVIEKYLNNLPPLLDLTVNIKQFNPYTLDFEVITKIQYLSFERAWVTYSQLQFQVTKLTINDGFIFDSQKENTIINDYSISNQIVTSAYANNVLGYNTLYMFFLRLDSLSINQQVVYPKLGEVLAQIGSIVQLLLVSKYIFQFINTQLYDQEIMQNIISIYFAGWKELSICRNVTGKILSVKQNNQQIDPQEYTQLRNKISLEFQKKFDIINIIHQIAKLEQCLLNINDQEIIKKIVLQKQNLNFKIYNNEMQNIDNRCQILPLEEEKEEIFKQDIVSLSQQSPQTEIKLFTLFDEKE